MIAHARRLLSRWPRLHALLRGPWGALQRLGISLRETRPALRYWRALLPSRAAAQPVPGSRVVMLVVSDLHIDPRVRRSAQVLAAAGFEVCVICPDVSNLPAEHKRPLDWGPAITFEILPWQAASFLMNFPWLLGDAMHAAAVRHRPYAFHCHDLTTAVIGLSAARTTGARCVCDFHEWYSENVSWDAQTAAWVPHPVLKKRCYRLAERLVMWRADSVITVCDSIAQELNATLAWRPREVTVIRNIPSLSRQAQTSYPPLRESLGLSPEQFILLWQGGTGPSRMIEPIIESLQHSPRVVFVIRGPSLDLFGEQYRALAAQTGVEDRLFLLPPVPSSDVVAAAVSADAGIWTLPNLSKNFFYALPNKIFEYLASGLPILVANYPEARRVIETYEVGLSFDPYDPRSIAAQMNRLANEPGLASRLRANIPAALQKIGADKEWEKLVALYRSQPAGAAI